MVVWQLSTELTIFYTDLIFCPFILYIKGETNNLLVTTKLINIDVSHP